MSNLIVSRNCLRTSSSSTTSSSTTTFSAHFFVSKIIILYTIFFILLLIVSNFNQVESRTIESSRMSKKFSNDYDFGSEDHFLSDSYFQMLSDSPSSSSMSHHGSLKELFSVMITASKLAKKHAERVKMKFLKTVIKSPIYFEKSVADWKEDWLPMIPAPSESQFITKYDGPEDGLKAAFHYLQYYVIGMQQILMDIMLHDGKMLNDFKRVDTQLHQLLCEIRIGMQIRGIEAKIDPKLMAKEFKDIRDSSRRNTRDYLILRDYIESINYLMEMFVFLKLKYLM